ncbi:MAG: hypothetical protein HY556_11050 [Euryarchaeota archaeon]|nr:hypothetical protein [Euryarchaeota archaeon]
MTGKNTGRQFRKVLAFALFATLVVTPLLPAANAAHRGQWDSGVAPNDTAWRSTYEPDDESTEIFTPGTPIDNCFLDVDGVGAADLTDGVHDTCETGVVRDDIGNGNTFMDVRLMNQQAPAGSTTYLPYPAILRNLGATNDEFMVGNIAFYAWFGFWDDLDGDDLIDDKCAYLNDATDEFTTRGMATGENFGTWDSPTYDKLVMLYWLHPGNWSRIGLVAAAVTDGPDLGERLNWPGPDGQINDRSGGDGNGAEGVEDNCPSNTGWFYEEGGSYQVSDAMLHDTVMATAMNPATAAGEDRAFKLEDVDYVDIDRYVGVNPMVESLWYAGSVATEDVLNDENNATAPYIAFVSTTANDTLIVACEEITSDPAGCEESSTGTIGDFVVSQADPVVALGDAACNLAANSDCADLVPGLPSGVNPFSAATPVHPHEPNTPDDKYGCGDVSLTCNATYGGSAFAGTCSTDTTDNPVGSCNGYTGYGSGWHAWVDVWPYLNAEAFRRAKATPNEVSGVPVGQGSPLCTQALTCTGDPYSQPPGSHGTYNDKVLGPGEYLIAPRSVAGGDSWNGFTTMRLTAGIWSDGNDDSWIGNAAATAATCWGTGQNGAGTNNNLFGAANSDPRSGPDNRYAAGECQEPNDYDDGYGPTNLDGEFISCGNPIAVPIASATTTVTPLTGDGLWPANAPVLWFREFNEPGKWSNEHPGEDDIVAPAGAFTFANGCVGPQDTVIFSQGNFAPFDVKITSTYVIRVKDPTDANAVFVDETVVDVDVFTRVGGA